MKKITHAVIPVAGFGTRMLPLSKSVPKELLPLGNRPAIHYVVEEAIAAGIKHIEPIIELTPVFVDLGLLPLPHREVSILNRQRLDLNKRVVASY